MDPVPLSRDSCRMALPISDTLDVSFLCSRAGLTVSIIFLTVKLFFSHNMSFGELRYLKLMDVELCWLKLVWG